MKKLMLTAFLVLSSFLLTAQWTTSGTNIYNSNTGNIGIGITNPLAKLDIALVPNASLRVGVVGNRANTVTQLSSSAVVIAENSSSLSTNGAVAWDFYNNGTNPSWAGTFMQHYGSATAGNQYGVLASNQGSLVFQNVTNAVITSNGSHIHVSPSGTVSTTFLTNGSVGIGTTTTGSFKLAVEGKIAAREVRVTATTPFPDYVFKEGYKLMPLNKLAQYIQINKHLPNIPSEKQIEAAGGVELGNMNNKLLEKIEELTLYVVEINKKLEKLEAENRDLRKSIR